jgi:hypothetical protein
MAIIQELTFFSWKDFQNDLQNLGDLERFQLVIETMPDIHKQLQKLVSAFVGQLLPLSPPASLNLFKLSCFGAGKA